MSSIAAEHVLESHTNLVEKRKQVKSTKKAKKLINEKAEVGNPEETIDRAHCTDPKKNKNRATIAKFHV